MIPGSLPSASIPSAGCTPNGWCTKLYAFTAARRAAQQRMRGLIWNFYADFRIYRANPSQHRRRVLRTQFDRVFRRRIGFVTRDRLRARLHANKAELLMVLERPEVRLHTNGSENDIRCQVTRRKVSAGTRSDAGRDAAMPSSGWPRLAPNMAWHFGIISAAGSQCPVSLLCRR
jgi:hypothetical protein